MGAVGSVVHPLACICSVHGSPVKVLNIDLVPGVDGASWIASFVSAELEFPKDAISAVWGCIVIFASAEVS